MQDLKASATSSTKNSSVLVPWWVRLCRWLWRVLLFVWGTLVVGIVIGTISNLNTTSTDTSPEKLYIIHVVTTYPFPTIVGTGILLLLTVISWIGSRKPPVSPVQPPPNKIWQDEDKEVLRRYVATVIREDEYLEPINIPQSPQRLISFSAPLDKVFIRLHAIYDRPLYDIGRDLRRLIEKLQQYLLLRQELKELELSGKGRQERIQQLRQELKELELSDDDRHELIQQLSQGSSLLWLSQVVQGNRWQSIFRKKTWQELIDKLQHHVESDEDREELRRILQLQLSQRWVEGQEKQDITIEAVLQKLNALKPAAIILGGPGSGKSTSMRWLKRQMAYAYDSPSNTPSKGLSPAQIPILIKIRDYAIFLNKPGAKELTFQQFFHDHLAGYDSNLPMVIQNELVKGHCLLLFDGLDEVADESLRRHIRESIHKFISTYSPGDATIQSYNRFIVTSRIVGYEAASFDNYAHYTFLDLEDKQIEQFLTNWFLAIGRRLTQDKYGTEKLLPQQEEEAQNLGTEQRDLLLNAIKSNPGVKRLAVNPLSLSILALSLLSEGKALPHRRINLYQKVTLLFLDNQNQGTGGRKTFTKKEVRLAEHILSKVAYQLHSSDRPLTSQEVREITRETMAAFDRLSVEQIDSDDRVEPFIETLRRSSGLFVEIGPDFFAFMHRSFQEYYVAMYLSSQPLDELTDFVRSHYSSSLWREPLLLLIASKSEKNQSVDGSDSRKQADVLLRTILNTTERCDAFLQRNFLFAATSLLDCDAWKIDEVLQQDIANHLFDLYSDSFGAGRFIQLQQDFEKVFLLWLQEQPSDSRTPLLETWSSALCDDKNRVRQEGAVHLLAAIAPDLADCPRSVLHALVPPLLQLAEALDISYPPEEVQRQLPKRAARSSSLKVQEYAFVALCLLDAAGPADWLYQKWFRWSQGHPDSLGRLNEHARDLQIQLLHANNRARYPHTYLLWRLLKKEELKASDGVSWRIVWDAVLQEEMTRGYSATYQSCLYLRLLLWKGNKEQNRKIAHELMKALLAADQQQIQAITIVTNIYLLGLLNLLEPQIMGYSSRGFQELQDAPGGGEPQDLLFLRDFRKLPEQLRLQNLRDLRSLRDIASSQVPLNLILYFLRFGDPINLETSTGFLELSEFLNLDIQKLLASLDLQDLLHDVQGFLRDLHDLQDPLGLRLMRVLLDVRDDLDIQVLLDLRSFLDRNHLAEILCNILEQQRNVLPSRVLLALYSVISGDTAVPSSIGRQIQASTQAFRQQAHSLTKEHSLLISAILRLLSGSAIPVVISVPSLSETPDLRAAALQTLKQEDQLTKSQVEEILAACTDTRELSEETQKEVKALTVQQAAWQVLDRPFSIEEKSVPAVVQALGDTNTIVCAAAALLLQRASTVPASERDEAVERILAFLTDDELSHRPLELPDYTRNWQLSEVLFETLKVLAEGEG